MGGMYFFHKQCHNKYFKDIYNKINDSDNMKIVQDKSVLIQKAATYHASQWPYILFIFLAIVLVGMEW